MKTRLQLACVALALGLATAAGAKAAEAPKKWIQIEGLVNTESAFMVAVDVDHADRVYRGGETMTVTVQAEKDCYVYLAYYSGNDSTLLFPNQHQTNNFVPAHTPVKIPGNGAPFQFRTSAPYGQEVLHVMASTVKIDALENAGKQGPFKALATQDLKNMVVEVKDKKQSDWAEARIDILTYDPNDQAAPPPPDPDAPPSVGKTGKRYGVCIGISQYQHERIQDLQVSHIDAQKMAEALKQDCHLDDVVLLTNEQATRANIEQAIFHDLVQKSHAGDSVFIFFSGHGGRTADQNGDEEDGFDEYLVPNDGILGKEETMILDDTFARWMQELSGRQIAIFMDNCYSGGASKSIDGGLVPSKSVTPAGAKGSLFDGMEAEIKRTKDLGQQQTCVLAACQANQLAWEMPASQSGSVLTHYLLESLKDDSADANKDGNLTVQESYQFIQQKVETYVKDKFQADQNPVIVDNAPDGIIFKQKQ
ncbi:MAG: caspase family protein [Planctomycetales bacterium]|nr:caspase family protein [Planctomycetales bacterium]